MGESARVQRFEASSRIIPMEGVRGLAVLLVFCVHYSVLFQFWAIERSATERLWSFLEAIGHSGVDLFFVLSGFLIYGTIISKKTPYLTYLARRVERIYPPFIVVFAIYLALSVLFPSENKVPSGASGTLYLIENVLLLPGLLSIPPFIAVAWSLSYEMFFYICVPMIVLGLGMREWRSRTRLALFGALGIGYALFCTLGIHPRLQLLMFISGIFLFEAMRAAQAPADLGTSLRRDVIGTLALIACFPVAYVVTRNGWAASHQPSDAYYYGWFVKVLVQFTLFPIFLFACFRSTSFLSAIFSGRFIRHLGNMSYSYYLLHGLALKFAAVVLHHFVPAGRNETVFWIALPLAFAATWMSSLILNVVVEQRFSALARRPKRSLRSESLQQFPTDVIPVERRLIAPPVGLNPAALRR